MRTSHSRLSARAARNRNRAAAAGFTLLEVLVALTVFVIGLSGMAALVAQMADGTERSRLLSTATTLVAEKLEDLNRWPKNTVVIDPHIAAGGSLTADVASGATNYYDEITLSSVTGQVSESIASTTGGTTTYTNVIHSATGYVDTAGTNVPITAEGGTVFHRRWLIEADPVVNGVTLTGSRRITVRVTQASTSSHPVSFQMSAIRP
jgi:prepilin-type N-terminal cleavage/methylation domain-containing protein